MRALSLSLALVAIVGCSQTTGTARGIVTAVDGDLEKVTSFTLLIEGSPITFLPVEDGDYDFPLSHLHEHQRTGEPVFVDWELVGTVRYALSLADG